MSDTSTNLDPGTGGGFLSDIGSAFSGAADTVGNFANSAWNGVSGLFGDSGSATSTSPAASSGATGVAAPTSPDLTTAPGIFGGSYGGGTSNLFSGAASTPNTAAATLPTASTSPILSPTSAVSGFLGPDVASPSGINFAAGADTSSGTSPATKTPESANWLQQLTGDLGLGTPSTSQILKGLVGAGGLAYSAFAGSPSSGAEKQLKSLSSGNATQGQQLQQYLQNGTLPAGQQALINQTLAGQQAAIRAQHAANGTSGSSMEVQDLNNAATQAQIQASNLATNLLSQGITETQGAGQLTEYLGNMESADQQQVMKSLQNFITALSSGGSGSNNASP